MSSCRYAILPATRYAGPPIRLLHSLITARHPVSKQNFIINFGMCRPLAPVWRMLSCNTSPRISSISI